MRPYGELADFTRFSRWQRPHNASLPAVAAVPLLGNGQRRVTWRGVIRSSDTSSSITTYTPCCRPCGSRLYQNLSQGDPPVQRGKRHSSSRHASAFVSSLIPYLPATGESGADFGASAGPNSATNVHVSPCWGLTGSCNGSNFAPYRKRRARVWHPCSPLCGDPSGSARLAPGTGDCHMIARKEAAVGDSTGPSRSRGFCNKCAPRARNGAGDG